MLCEDYRTSFASDETSITIDSWGEYDTDALADTLTIINTLGLPESLYDGMCGTNALMGRQKETYGNYEVDWSFHPDNGLDVIFKYIG